MKARTEEDIVITEISKKEKSFDSDIGQIMSLAEFYREKRLLLKKSRRKVERMIEKWELLVVKGKEQIKGFGACTIVTPQKAKIHFLAAKKGNPFVTERLIKRHLEILEKIGIEFVFLTTKADNRMRSTVFKRCGFQEIPLWKLPFSELIPLILRRLMGRHSIAMGRNLQGAV